MTTIKTALLATAAVFAFGTAAQAADPILPAPVTPVAPAPVTFDWNGFYAGLNAGFGMGELYDEDGDVFAFDDDLDSVNGFLGGVQAGANFQMDMFVLGVEGDIQLTTMSQETLDAPGGDDIIVNLDYFGTLRARAGVALDNVLPYVTGGLAFGGLTIEDDGGTDSNNHFGWTVGGGVEVAMDTNTSFKIEYLYTDLGLAEYDTGGEFNGDDAGFRFHTVRAGVNFHF